jgi:hypothetical protein
MERAGEIVVIHLIHDSHANASGFLLLFLSRRRSNLILLVFCITFHYTCSILVKTEWKPGRE